jgi:hypothetical protein
MELNSIGVILVSLPPPTHWHLPLIFPEYLA